MRKIFTLLTTFIFFTACFSENQNKSDNINYVKIELSKNNVLSDNNDSVNIKVKAVYNNKTEDITNKAYIYSNGFRINSNFSTYIAGNHFITAEYEGYTSDKQIVNAQKEKNFFYKGADISFLPELEYNSISFFNFDNNKSNLIDILKENGINTIRLRLWVNNEYCNIDKTLYMAKQIRNAEMNFLLDIHYSDSWADPGTQEKPTAWRELSFEKLNKKIYSYTYEVLEKLINQNTPPQMIQIGNEINNGFLHPDGDLNQSWDNFASLINSAIKSINDLSLRNDVEVLLHIAGYDSADWFFSNITKYNIDYDIIGLSYYPWWHGKDIDKLSLNIVSLQETYNKNIMIMETAYPWTLSWNDWTDNVVGLEDQLIKQFPASPKGQEDYLNSLLSSVKISNGIGVFYWAPEWTAYKGIESKKGSTWENLTLFDFNNKVLNSVKVFNNY